MKEKKKKERRADSWKTAAIYCVFGAAIACLLFVLGRDYWKTQRSAEENAFAMDTVISARMEGKEAKQAAKQVLERIQELEKTQLSRFNETAALARANALPGQSIALLPETAQMLADMLLLGEKTGGAFDIRLGKVSDLWDFTGQTTQIPKAQELATALSQPRKVNLDNNALTVETQGILDLGAVGKGYACDVAKDILQTRKVNFAVVTVGGSVLTYGDKKEFRIGIRDPKGEAEDVLGEMTVAACCISTSGGYERYFVRDGKRYHHILDGRSGYPAESGVASVTILTKSGAMSDALSTACFVLGYQNSLALLKEYRADAVFVLEDNTVHMVKESGMQWDFRLTDAAYTVAS